MCFSPVRPHQSGALEAKKSCRSSPKEYLFDLNEQIFKSLPLNHRKKIKFKPDQGYLRPLNNPCIDTNLFTKETL